MRAVAVAATLLLAACGSQDAPAQRQVPVPASAASPLRPAAAAAVLTSGDRADGPVRSVAGTGLRLTPFRVVGGAGLSASQCGVLIEGQRLMTLGAGDLDAYTCLGLVELRAISSAGRAARIGLMYDAASRNVTLRTVAVVVRSAGGQWTVDADATTVFDDLPAKSWAAFAAALARARAR